MGWPAVVILSLLPAALAPADPDGPPPDPVEFLLGSAAEVPAPPLPGPGGPVFDSEPARIAPAAVAAGLALFPLVQAGIQRVGRDNVLDHPTRAAIYRLLWERGSASLGSVCDSVHVTPTNGLWHLQKLVRLGLVGVSTVGSGSVYYPRAAGLQARHAAEKTALLQNENARAVFDCIRRTPGIHQRAIARDLRMNHGTVRWHLERLVQHGLVQPELQGRRVRYAPAGQAQSAAQVPQAQPS